MSRQHGVFPFAPLGEVLARHLPEIAVGHGQFLDAGDFTRSADLLAVNRRTLTRYAAGQLLTIDAADRCAIRLGLHPALIWWDFDEVCDRVEREAASRRAASIARARARNRVNRQDRRQRVGAA